MRIPYAFSRRALSKWSSSPDPHAPYADHYQLKPALLQTMGTVVWSCLSYRAAQLLESIIHRMELRRLAVGSRESRMYGSYCGRTLDSRRTCD